MGLSSEIHRQMDEFANASLEEEKITNRLLMIELKR